MNNNNAKTKTKLKKEFGQVVLNEDQTKALEALKKFRKSDKREFVLDGVGGVGKTFLIRELFKRKKPGTKKDETYVPSTVLGIAVTHQAVLNLKKSIPNSKTYAAAANLMMDYDRDGNIYFIPRSGSSLFSELKEYKDIVVDECSQFSQQMKDVLIRNARKDTKFYFLGDHHQLPPIGLGNDLDSPTFDIQDKYTLTQKVRQQKGDFIAELCDITCEKIDTDHDISFLNNLKMKFNPKTKKGYSVSSLHNVIQSFVRNFNDGVDVRITSYRNSRIETLNKLIRQHLWGDDYEQKYVPGEFIILNDQYAPSGFPLAFNGQTFKVKEIWTEVVEFVECYILKVSKNLELCVPSEEGIHVYRKELYRLKEIALQSNEWLEYSRFKSRFANISYGYAINNYKIQGSTITGCYVDVSDIMDVKPLTNKRKLQAFYVGISRPTSFLALF